MTITFRGMARTHIIIGNDATAQNLFTIENQSASRVNVNVRQLFVQCDDTGALATVTPIYRVSRATSISGGQLVEKTPIDTTVGTSDSNVVFRAALIEMARITATAGDTIWERFDNRMHTAASQQKFNMPSHMGTKVSLLPYLVAKTGMEFKLRPSESLLIKLVAASAASNPAVSNNYFVEAYYEEEAVSTFPIGGTVTLSGLAVSGAKVIVIQADDISLTNPVLVGAVTTAGDGTWSSSIVTGKIGAAFVQYQTGGLYYTAAGSPFLS